MSTLPKIGDRVRFSGTDLVGKVTAVLHGKARVRWENPGEAQSPYAVIRLGWLLPHEGPAPTPHQE